MTDYDDAKFYDCRDSEHLVHDCPEDALEELLDDVETTHGWAGAIAAVAPATVTAYDVIPVTDRERASWEQHLVETLHDSMSDDHGDPDGNLEILDRDDPELRRLARALVDAAVAKARLWTCESVGKRVYSAAELEVMFAEHLQQEEEMDHG